ncbi:signal peptidase I [Aeromicrobium flavum]|uniref:signal peptidase I n=1 Tax=Aeromicrobium flavum TaxID=416568 RepID=UPI002482C567|nr:signal peptidase I [Aeromicrobium flavum]
MLSLVGNTVLWVAAVLGAISLVLGLATVVAGVQPLVFRSSSMAPAIEAGALGLARTVDADEVKVDDIVSVTNTDGIRVTHRVVKVTTGAGDQVSLTLQGDANRGPDEEPYLVTEVDRVFFDVPYLGYLANWLSSPWAMFAAGLLVALVIANLWRRPGSDTGRRAKGGSAAATVAAVGLAAASLMPVPRTEAFFTDPAMFEAGQIHAHLVRIFDWGSPVCSTDAGGNSVTLRTLVASPRYQQVWYVAPEGQPLPATPVLRISPPGPLDTPVATQITRTMLGGAAATAGNYQVVGRSELKGSGTTPWFSESTRSATVSITSGGALQCGTVNLPPAIVFTTPPNGATYTSPSAALAATRASCAQNAAPCGTATDSDGILRVEYRLQRNNFWLNRCWDPDSGYPIFIGCGTWRPASVTPAVPTSVATPVSWRVPLMANGTSPLAESGTYTLYLRVTDNSAARTVSERTIQFTIG